MRCEPCRDLLLDHLYDLLDPSEAAQVDAHLSGCPDCATARAAAALDQGLIARAAKVSFPTVTFVPPDQAVTVDLAGTIDRARAARPLPNGTPVEPAKPARPAPRAGSTWGRWVVAASLLVLIPAAVLPVSGWASKYEASRRTANRAAAESADARSAHSRLASAFDRDRTGVQDALASAKQRHDKLLADWIAEEKAAAAPTDAIAVEIDRPASLQPGAPNEFVVSVRGKGRDPVEAEVRDQDDKVVFRQTLDHEKKGDRHPIRLPADVWAKVGPRSELFLVVSKVDEKTGARTPLQDSIRLFGPVYATLLVTDKPVYRPGEKLFFRSLTLDRVSFRPPGHEQLLRYELRKIDNKPDGTPVAGLAIAGSSEAARVTDGGVETVTGPDGKPVRGVGSGSLALPQTLPDGDYVLVLTEQKHPAGYAPTLAAPVKRSIRVRAGDIERYQKRIGFAAASYGPGETVEAWAELKSADKPVAGVLVEAAVLADNSVQHVQVIPAKTRADGRVGVMFEVPKKLARGDIELRVKFKVPTGDEAVSERVPVAGRDLIVEFFPEGGEMIANVPGRVYVRATRPNGQPADIRGAVTDGTETVARVETVTDPTERGANRGLGVVTLTPKLGAAYTLTVDGRPTPFTLPKVRNEGVSLSVLDTVTSPGQPVRVRLHSAGQRRNLVVGAYTRGRLSDTKRVTADANMPVEVALLTGDDPRGGVVRVTVFEEPADAGAEWVPVAERLVFRKPGEKLNLAYTAKTADGAVDLSVTATDEKGNPAAAILWASVVNEAVVDQPRDRLMPTHFLLAGETESPDALEYADFLLTDHPKAAASLDMVLATQGWRRFVEQKRPAADNKELTATDARLLATNGQFPIGMEASAARKHRELHAAFWPKVEAAAKELDAARKKSAAPVDSRQVDAARERADVLRAESLKASDEADWAAAPLRSLRGWAWFAVAGLVGLAAVLAGVTCVKPNGLGGVLPLGIGTAAVLGLASYFGVTALHDVGTERVASDVMPTDKAMPKKIDPPKGMPLSMHMAKAAAGGADDPPQGRAVPKKLDPAFLGHGVKPPHPLLDGGAQKMFPPDALRDLRGAVRTHVAQGFASDAVEDPTLAEARKAAEVRAADFKKRLDEATPTLDPVAIERVRMAIPRMAPLVVREYAAPRPGTPGATAVESDTVLWLPLIVLPTDGKTGVAFGLGAGVNGYQVTIAGHTADGRIGAVRGVLPVAPAAKAVPRASAAPAVSAVPAPPVDR